MAQLFDLRDLIARLREGADNHALFEKMCDLVKWRYSINNKAKFCIELIAV